MIRLGLMRHYQVMEPFPKGWVSAHDLFLWMERYDRASIDMSACAPDLGGVVWKCCISSDQPRALGTAQHVFEGTALPEALLREVRFGTFATGKLKLPVGLWHLLMRAAWMTGHASQRVYRNEFKQRVIRAADLLCQAACDTLVVSHAGMMIYLSAELRRRGFQGPKLGIPHHGKTYVFQRGSRD